MNVQPDGELVTLQSDQAALDRELQPLLEAPEPDWTMLMRLRDVATEHAARARQLEQRLVEQNGNADLIEEVIRLRKYFDGTAYLIAQETGEADEEASESSVAGPRRA